MSTVKVTLDTGEKLTYTDATLWEDDDAVHIESGGETVHIQHHGILLLETFVS